MKIGLKALEQKIAKHLSQYTTKTCRGVSRVNSTLITTYDPFTINADFPGILASICTPLCFYRKSSFLFSQTICPLNKIEGKKKEKTTREKKERFSRNLSRNLLLFSTSAGTSKSYIKPEVPAFGTINTFRPLEIRLELVSQTPCT